MPDPKPFDRTQYPWNYRNDAQTEAACTSVIAHCRHVLDDETSEPTEVAEARDLMARAYATIEEIEKRWATKKGA